MKGWLALHKDKWYPIKDMVDTGKPAHEQGGGNVYHLDGVDKPVHQSEIKDMKPPEIKKREDKIPGGLADKKSEKDFNPKSLKQGTKVELEHTSDKSIAQEIAMDHLTEDSKYYKKLKEVEKQDMVQVTADGKRELVEGKEPLKKDPKDRWKEIKKSLDNSSAIMDIEQAMESDDEPDTQDAQAPEEVSQEGDQSSEEPAMESPEADAQTDENADQDPQEALDPKEAEEKIIQALKDEGYSDVEISYIVHGHHAPESSQTDAAKAQATSDMSSVDVNHAARQADLEHEHARRMNDLEYESKKNESADPEVEKGHRKRMLDLEYQTTEHKKKQAELELEHKKRMLDLEYEKAKHEASKKDPSEDTKQKQLEFEMEMKRKEKELELEFKKKELALKLEIQKEQAKQKAEHAAAQAEEDAKVNAAVKKEQAKHKIAAAKEPPKPDKSKGGK